MYKRFPSTFVDSLREKADIVEVVNSYVPLKKNGHKHWGLCPFHNEKTASFSVDETKQLYYCFSCKAAGNVIGFVMAIERVEFAQAVKLLADRLHMPLPEMQQDPNYQKKREQNERLLECNRQAAQFFYRHLYSPQGAKVLAYLKDRGLSDSVIKRFGIGAAPDGWDTLTKHLQKAGFTLNELQQVGLTVLKEAAPKADGTPVAPRSFDMFRSRAMFPIIDQYGRILAFGGRALPDGRPPKYMNTSDTPVFNKRLGVFAANLLRKERHLDRVILVEGYMDVVSLSQYGVKGVCATLGTALTQEQARLLKRFAPKVYLAYDGDKAGQHAILRGLDILQAQGIPCRVLDFPDGLDPDEFIRRDGPEGFEQLPAISPEIYRMRRLREEHDLSTQSGRTDYAKACAAVLRNLQPVELEGPLQDLIVQTGFARQVLLAQIHQTAPRTIVTQLAPQAPRKEVQPSSTIRSSMQKAPREEQLLIGLIASGRLPNDIISPQSFSTTMLQNLCSGLQNGRSAASMLDDLETEEERAEATRLLLSPTGEDLNETLKMARDCINQMQIRQLKARAEEIKAAIPLADGQERGRLLIEYKDITTKLNKMHSSSN